MKKIIGSMLVIASVVMNGCGGSSSGSSSDENKNSEVAEVRVNLLGSWDYAVFTKNNLCDGLLAQGTEVTESLNGDRSKIGDSIVQGTTFALDGNQNCYLTSINKILTHGRGEKSTMTRQEYISFHNRLTAGDDTIKSYTVTSFSQFHITSVTGYGNGSEMTQTSTR